MKGRCLNRLTMEPSLKESVAVQRFLSLNQQCPILPGSFPPSTVGAKELNYCVRDGNRCSLPAIFTGFSLAFFPLSEKRLRFSLREYPQNQTMYIFLPNHWSSVRPISIGQLHALLRLHLRPINVIVSHGSYL